MGAKFLPSIANLFMGEWEDKYIFPKKRKELLFYKQYIDDLMFIWEGPESSLIDYLAFLNSNNIKLTSQWSKDQINVLDVNIYRVNDQLETKVQTIIAFCPSKVDITLYG